MVDVFEKAARKHETQTIIDVSYRGDSYIVSKILDSYIPPSPIGQYQLFGNFQVQKLIAKISHLEPLLTLGHFGQGYVFLDTPL